jgi:3-oxoacyl-[acyl-carrier-protein] synthase III
MLTSVRSYLPPQRLTNHELAALYEGWSADKIYEKTGIRERRVVAPEVCASDLAYAAAAQLLEGNDPGGIDALIFCTQTPDYFLPTTASLLQERLRLSQRCAAFDLNQGCSGYIYSLAVASGMIASGLAARVLLATADTYTRLIHPLDKSTRTLFGDAGTASLLEAGAKSRLHGFVFGTDGRGP